MALRDGRSRNSSRSAKEAAGKGWWETYSQTIPPEYSALIGMEAEARAALSWAPLIVPGLLQTADYAREVTNGFDRRDYPGITGRDQAASRGPADPAAAY